MMATSGNTNATLVPVAGAGSSSSSVASSPNPASPAASLATSSNPVSPGTAQISDPNRKKTTGPLHNPRYKSILCDHWERNNGTCPYAEKCQFAHGQQELAKWQAHRARQQQQQQIQLQQQHFAATSNTAAHRSQAASATAHHLHYNPQHVLPQHRVAPPSHLHLNSPAPVMHHPSMHHQQNKMHPYSQLLQAPPPPPPHMTPLKQATQSNVDYFSTASSPSIGHQYPSLVPPPASHHQQYQQHIFSAPPQQRQSQQISSPPTALYSHHHSQAFSSNTSSSAVQYSLGSPNSASADQQLTFSQMDYNATMKHHAQLQSRDSVAGSTASSSPMSSPFPSSTLPSHLPSLQSLQSSRRSSLSPEDIPDLQSIPELDQQHMISPRRDPRRTASLPQLFSRDFLSSLTSAANEPTDQNGSYDYRPGQTSSNHASLSGRLSVELPSPAELPSLSSSPVTSSSTIPRGDGYSSYRRGSAPPVVLSVVTNSLADLDSLADELVSESSANASQLFNMTTVFPGSINNSIKGSINEYL